MRETKVDYVNVSRETFTIIDRLFDQFEVDLEAYIQRLLWWNKTINLVSRNATIDIIRKHVKHSLLPAIIPDFQKADTVLDAGSGGGLPGIPLALCYRKKKTILNDISGKKTTVLTHLKRELDLTNVRIANYPISEYPEYDAHIECILSKHAFKIDEILRDISHGQWDTLIMLKGDNFRVELSEIPYPVSIECHRLKEGSNDAFYHGKVLLKIQRI